MPPLGDPLCNSCWCFPRQVQKNSRDPHLTYWSHYKGWWWCLFIWFWFRSWDLTDVNFLSQWLLRPNEGKVAEMFLDDLYHHMNQFDILKIFLGFGMSIWRSTHVIHILPPIADATKNGISDQMMLECGMILDVTPNTVQPVQSQFCASLQLGTGQANKTDQF